MFCKNCGAKINDNYIFCKECGAKIDIEKNSNIVKKQNNIKKNTVIEEIMNHLSFLGYNNEYEEKEDSFKVIADHPTKNSFFIIGSIENNYIIFASQFITKKKSITNNMKDATNDVNKNDLMMSNFHYYILDNIVYMRIRALYYGKYSKENFSNFLDLINMDIKSVFISKNIIKAFI